MTRSNWGSSGNGTSGQSQLAKKLGRKRSNCVETAYLRSLRALLFKSGGAITLTCTRSRTSPSVGRVPPRGGVLAQHTPGQGTQPTCRLRASPFRIINLAFSLQPLSFPPVFTRHTVTNVYNQVFTKARPVTFAATNRHLTRHKTRLPFHHRASAGGISPIASTKAEGQEEGEPSSQTAFKCQTNRSSR